MTWLYEQSEFSLPEDANPKDLYGFVYLIENTANGRKYVGKKFFWKSKVLPITKTRKRRQRLKVESDWKEYYGSSEELSADVNKFGVESFKRTILHLCATKGECAYLEAKEQFDREVLLSEDYYNSWIAIKVRKNHISRLHLTKTML
jgi:hypothetical protein